MASAKKKKKYLQHEYISATFNFVLIDRYIDGELGQGESTQGEREQHNFDLGVDFYDAEIELSLH